MHTVHTAKMRTLNISAFSIHAIHTAHTAIFNKFQFEIPKVTFINTLNTAKTLYNPPTRFRVHPKGGYYGKKGVFMCLWILRGINERARV